MAFGEQRLIGSVEWTQQGRVFDGVRLASAGKTGDLSLFMMKLREDSAPGSPRNSYFGGAYAHIIKIPHHVVDLYAFYDRLSGRAGVDRLTAGLYWKGKQRNIDYRLQFAHQAGDLAGSDINANLLAATLGLSFGKQAKGRVALWYDYLSGDDDASDGKSRVFNTLFATNHKFYGFADYFLNIPVHTANRGIQDAALRLSVVPEKRVKLAQDVHGFWAATSKGMPSGSLGKEVDLTLSVKYRKPVTIVAGFSRFIVDDGMTFIRGLKEDGNFGYVMANVVF